MKPLAENFIAKAEQSLNEARAVAGIGLFEAAGRAAYLAAYHAAQAYIFNITGKIAKTHSGVRSEFARLTKDDHSIERKLTTFLARAYNLKTIADYGVDFGVSVGRAEADEAIAMAAQFVECIDALVHEQR